MRRQVLLGCIFYFVVFATDAQAPNILWQKCYGGSWGDVPVSFRSTGDGGYAFAAHTYSSNADADCNHGFVDGWLVKIDNEGIIQWRRCYGGSDGDDFHGMDVTKDKGYILLGTSQSTDGDLSEVNLVTGPDHFWFVKTDSSGNIQWQKVYGGSLGEEPTDVHQTFDKGYIGLGYTQSNDGDISGNHGSNDIWVVKLDSTGNLQWQNCFGGSKNDVAYTIRQVTDSGYILTGVTSSNDGDVTDLHIGPGYSSFDAWVVRLDKMGNIKWQKCLGGTGSENSHDVQILPDGSYIIAAWSNSANDGDVSGMHVADFGNGDYWIVKLDTSGNILWQRCYGGSGDEVPASIHQTQEGGYIVAGNSGYYYNGVDGDLTSNYGKIDYWVVKFDSVGTLQWQKSLGGSDYDDANSVLQDSNGDYIVAGYTGSSNHDVTGNHGDFDTWVVKLSFTNGVTDLENDDSNFEVYPNPFGDLLMLYSSNAVPRKILLFNLIGELIYSQYFQTSLTLDVSVFPSGLYLVQLRSEKNELLHEEKLVKE